MSDPVSNAEIEDVLSSIRRLVSVDDRPDVSAAEQSDTSGTMVSDASHGGAENRLVLTPALRVDASDTDPQPESESQAEPADTAQDTAQQDPPTEDPDESALRFSHSAYDHEQQDTADDTAEDHSADEDDSAETDAASDDAAHVDDDPYVLDQTQAADPSQAPGLGDRIAEVEAAVAAQDDQWEPDGESDDAYSGGAVSPMAWEDYGPEPAYDDADGADDANGDAPMNDAAENADDTKNLVSEVSQASDLADDQRIKPNDETAGAYGPDALHASDSSDEMPDEASLWDDERADTVIDEEALRDMVSEIVRQELQGALGERITRNVRKLVRREIHRALSSHELD